MKPTEIHPAARHTWSWSLGSIAKIPVRVHATFLILLGWIATSRLIAGQGVRGAALAVFLTVSVFIVVVVHEMGHALMARHFGIKTRGILLLPIGGVSELERIPDEPRQELLVTAAGPAVNVVLAAAFGALSHVVPQESRASVHLLRELSAINVVLAVFNLLPAFPMDGGRVLRAALSLRMPRMRATEIAARMGQGMALLFGLAGLFLNPLLIFTALFVWIGSQYEHTMEQMRVAFHGLKVEDAMVTRLEALPPDATIERLVADLHSGFQRAFPVVDDAGQPLGIVTSEDAVKAAATGRASSTVGSIMRADATQLEEHAPLVDAVREHGIELSTLHALPIVRSGRIIGLLTDTAVKEILALRTVGAPGH